MDLDELFKSEVNSILDDLGIDYAQYDFTDTVDGGRYELAFKIQGTYTYLDLGIFDFSEFGVYTTSTRDEIKNAILEMNNEVIDKLKYYNKEINSILSKWK